MNLAVRFLCIEQDGLVTFRCFVACSRCFDPTFASAFCCGERRSVMFFTSVTKRSQVNLLTLLAGCDYYRRLSLLTHTFPDSDRQHYSNLTI